jgi:ketosteroid isomerase-like protein
MSELEDFRNKTLRRQAEAEEALVHGDVEPRLAMWSRRDPVSVLGALGPNKTGWDDVSGIFRWVAERFSKQEITDFRFDVEVAEVSGDMAYSVGYERFNTSVDGGPKEPYTVRVTHVYRREDGEWKIVHRHGDVAPVDQSVAAEASESAG